MTRFCFKIATWGTNYSDYSSTSQKKSRMLETQQDPCSIVEGDAILLSLQKTKKNAIWGKNYDAHSSTSQKKSDVRDPT